MIGEQDTQSGMFCYAVQLEKRIPQNHPLRAIKKALDLRFVRAAVSGFYGHNGNVSVAPEVIVKLMVLLFLDDIASERELMRMLPYRLDYLWFLDYGLDSTIPDHSVLSKARRRWGSSLFEQLFVESVKQCCAAGLVDGKKLYVDGSLVDANASCGSVKRGSEELLLALKRAYQREERKFEDGDGPASTSGPDAGGGSAPGSSDKAVNNNLLCSTDPDAALVRHGSLSSRPRYKHHRAVDDLCGVITAVETTPGDVAENRKLMDLVDQSERNVGTEVSVVVGDCQYGTIENFRRCMERGLKPHLGDFADKARRGHKRKSEIFGEEKFVYDAGRDVYVCPAGNLLKRRHYKPLKAGSYYGCSAKLCWACELRPQCTRAKTGRTVIRHEGQELVDAARAISRSFKARRDRRKRKWLMEGSFADAANNHGFKRSRWRGLIWQKVQDWMIAVCQNLRTLVGSQAPKNSRALLKTIFIAAKTRFDSFFKLQIPNIVGLKPIFTKCEEN